MASTEVSRARLNGFTIVELLVVLAAIALLLSIVAPRYIEHLDTAREVVLKEDLHQMRDAIDKFYSDQARYPASLDELVEKRYLRAIPEDPMTEKADSWTIVPTTEAKVSGVFDVRSGAQGSTRSGQPYAAL